MTTKIAEWIDEVEELYDRLNRLLLLDDLAWRFREVVLENEQLRAGPPELLDVFWDGYVHQASAAVRALADRNPDSHSYAVLISDILRHHDSLLSAPETGPVQSMATLRAWDEELQAVVQPVRKYVNKEVAHFARKRAEVTYLELRKATYALGRLHQRLELMLKANHLHGPMGVRQYDWTAPLRVRWWPEKLDRDAFEAAALDSVAAQEGWEDAHPYP